MSVRRVSAVAVGVAAVLVVGGCGSDTEGDAVTSETVSVGETAPPSSPIQSDDVSSSPQQTAAKVCGLLSKADVAPLTDGPVGGGPEPVADRPIPGCKWPVADGWGWLEIGLWSPASEDAITEIAEKEYAVAGGTSYVTISDGPRNCTAYVKTPGAPSGQGLRLKLDSTDATEGEGLCAKANPQVEKVLTGLGW